MHSRSRVWLALPGVVTVMVGTVIAAPAVSLPLAQVGATSAGSPLRGPEREFILQSIDGGRRQAELARLAVSQASSSELRDFAQQLTGDYRDFNEALETLARRKALEVPVQPASYPTAYRNLAERTGAAFDREYLRQAAAASERALRACEAAVANARDPDVRALAGTYLPILRGHVNRSTALEKTL